MYSGVVVSVGDLFRVARTLREVALEVARDPGEDQPSEGLVVVTEDIAHHDGTTVGEIAARTGVAQSFVSHVVARLREGGVVETVVDEGDRRRSRIQLTASARGQLFPERGRRDVEEALFRRLPELSAAERSRIEAALEQLASVVARSRERH